MRPAAVLVLGLTSLALVSGCISGRQTLTPEAAQVKYVEGKLEPGCQMIEEITVGREWFVTDERQPAKSKDDVVVRMRRLAAKRGGNLVVILENEPPGGKCSGYNGLGRVYRCSAEELAKVASGPGPDEATAASVGGDDAAAGELAK
ncbi:MAG: DUF4156 domain-containing protein [Polyangiaceae bacterium]